MPTSQNAIKKTNKEEGGSSLKDATYAKDLRDTPPEAEGKCPRKGVDITEPEIPTHCDRYLVTVISAASQSTGRDVAGEIYGLSTVSGAPTFPPCTYRHIPLDDTPASSGIRPGLRWLGLSPGQPRCVAPQN